MINKITVSENRGLYPIRSNLGTIGERNATELVFQLPASLQGYAMSLVIVTVQGSFVYDLRDNTFTLPSEVLTDNTLELQLVLKDNEDVIWKSIPTSFYLNPTLDNTGENIVEKSKSEQREIDRTELGGALKDLTGEDVGGEEWDRLINKTKTLPIKTEQNIADLSSYTMLADAYRHITSAPGILTGSYKVDKENPDDPNSADILIKLPYLPTVNVTKFSANTQISGNIQECGLDIRSSPQCNGGYNRGMFNTGGSMQNVEKLHLTGIHTIQTMNYIFGDRKNLVEVKLEMDGDWVVPTESFREQFFGNCFNGCSQLMYITGDPIDLSVGTDHGGMFRSCSKLRVVRFKPGTIQHDLDLSWCSMLMKGKYESSTDDPGTLLSIVNGVRTWHSGDTTITIKFALAVKDYLTSWRCKKDEESGLYVSAQQGTTLATVLTNEKGVIIA